jgi:hypothetical protein
LPIVKLRFTIEDPRGEKKVFIIKNDFLYFNCLKVFFGKEKDRCDTLIFPYLSRISVAQTTAFFAISGKYRAAFPLMNRV